MTKYYSGEEYDYQEVERKYYRQFKKQCNTKTRDDMIDEIYGIINTNYYCDYCINGSMYIPKYMLPLDYIQKRWAMKKTVEAMIAFKRDFAHD
jgi:hypothetical protein